MTSLDRTVLDNSSGEPSPARRNGLDAEAATAANLLTGLAARLRTAYERGADIAGLAASSHQSVPEVRKLLLRAGVELSAERAGSAESADGTDGQRSPALAGPPTGAAHDPQRLRPVRRPTPSRRLSRLHPRIDPGPTDLSEAGGLPEPSEPSEPSDAEQSTPLPEPQTPMGILIGASPTYSEPAIQPEGRRRRRVPVRVVRVGRGTSLVVLPSWRPAIAVSVPTDLLLTETGLSPDRLADARLTVLMNPDALHDRELGLRNWRPDSENSGRRGRHASG